MYLCFVSVGFTFHNRSTKYIEVINLRLRFEEIHVRNRVTVGSTDYFIKAHDIQQQNKSIVSSY